MTTDLSIYPHRGIGPFILGSSKDTVVSAAGLPDAIETTEIAGNPREEWHYHQLHITLTFTEEDGWKLSSIAASGSNAVLNRIRFISQSASRLQALGEAAGVSDVRRDEDFGECGVCFVSEQSGMMWWAVDGVVVKLDLFPGYDEAGDQPCWPV